MFDLGQYAGKTSGAWFWLCLAAGLAECNEDVLAISHFAPLDKPSPCALPSWTIRIFLALPLSPNEDVTIINLRSKLLVLENVYVNQKMMNGSLLPIMGTRFKQFIALWLTS